MDRRVVLWNQPHKIDKIISPYIEQEDNGCAISLPLVEFMRNF